MIILAHALKWTSVSTVLYLILNFLLRWVSFGEIITLKHVSHTYIYFFLILQPIPEVAEDYEALVRVHPLLM